MQVGRAAARGHARRRHRGRAAAAVPGEYPVTGAGDGRCGDGQVATSGLGEGADAFSTASGHGSRRSDRQIPGAVGKRRDPVSRSIDAGRCDGHADSSLIRCADALGGLADDISGGRDAQAAGAEVPRKNAGFATRRRGGADAHVARAIKSLGADRDACGRADGDSLSGDADPQISMTHVHCVDPGVEAGDRSGADGDGLRGRASGDPDSGSGLSGDGAGGRDGERSGELV